MKTIDWKSAGMAGIALAITLAFSPAMAEKPSWAGGGKGADHHERGDKGHGRNDSRGDNRDDGGRRDHFEDRHRASVRDYYAAQYNTGHCPPGLAKKHNGCMPPGQAKKWHVGQPLPQGVVYYSVPQSLVVQIGLPPSGYRYVRVASDILMMAVGTRMIVDSIQDLGRI